LIYKQDSFKKILKTIRPDWLSKSGSSTNARPFAVSKRAVTFKDLAGRRMTFVLDESPDMSLRDFALFLRNVSESCMGSSYLPRALSVREWAVLVLLKRGVSRRRKHSGGLGGS